MVHQLGHTDTFAVYRLPNAGNHYLVRPRDSAMPFANLGDEPAFVFHPFVESTGTPALAIPVDELLINPVFRFRSRHSSPPRSIPPSEYPSLVKAFIQDIQRGHLHKAICSRIILKEAEAHDLYPLFMQLKEKYPSAFVYLIHIPGVGCWMGATPEVLLTDNGQVGETVALAGTRPLHSGGDWTEKEVLEQQMVERYMAHLLICRKMNFQKTGPFNARAGKVMHLKTRFRFPSPENWKGLALDIHPSPAVCGLPKQKAQDFILRHEPHSRAYYCGFLGPVNIHGQTDLFVNLRCMQVFQNTFALYVGGGITDGSIPEKELEETTWKSRTLSDIIEAVYCEPHLI